MLNAIYVATFEDARGTEATRIHNDGRELRIALRGVSFAGSDFDSLSPVAGQLERARELFTLQQEDLCACRLVWEMPLAIDHRGERHEGLLVANLSLGDPLPNGRLTSGLLLLELKTPSATIRSSGRSGWFEDELLELARQLGNGESIRSCITCAFSDYSPYGHGLFGSLACFRDAKEEYNRAHGKAGIFSVWNRMTEYVQETYLCDEYRLRAPGTGYRG
jgi:hypothetical protein